MNPESVIIFLTPSAAEELKVLRRRSTAKSGKIGEEWDLEKLVMKELDKTREAWFANLDDERDDYIFPEKF